MARKAGKAGFTARQEISSGILSRFRWGESYTSLFLGLIVVVIAAVLVFSLGKNRQVKQTSSIQDGPVNREEKKKTQKEEIKTNLIIGDSYKVAKEDSLWDIAVRAYGDGYKWVEIAKQNNLENPDLIFSENVLKIPR
ncbi:MAG: LysM peptidoglycan-binding domain-containing protein [Patescibacteria group bacterium]